MRHPTIALALPLALLLTACADSPVAPAVHADMAGHGALFSDHTYPEGNTVQGHYAPEVVTAVSEDRVELCATWTDFSSFEPSDPYVYSFDVDVQDGEEWERLGSAGGQGSPWSACFTTDPLDDGTYTFRVRGMANVPTGGTPPFSPHHTLYWEGQVTVGAALRFEVLIRDNASDDFASSADFNRQSTHWNFEFMIRIWDAGQAAFVPVTDCSLFPWDEIGTTVQWDAGAPASAATTLSWREPECTDEDGNQEPLDQAIYKVRLGNPTSGGSAEDRSGSVLFVFDGVENENEVTFTSSGPSGGLGPQGARP